MHLYTRYGSKVLLVCTAVALSAPLALAEPGQIIITRDVQPRSATRPAVVPDPNPKTVNPGAITTGAMVELSDGDVASVSTGSVLPGLMVGSPQTGSPLQIERIPSQNLPGMGAIHGGARGAEGGISGQVNRPLQQGLRPLQQLGGR
jgi:hypothetical protein